ncbi:uncharacterized protein LOC126672260 [Mercurialis annua]|uniref:uncharacterized protein LOC126672260 n=1 Tax=Mercurialis annua TaxID=3986 RepID=UPI002160BF76|nr:uncharacterized protein LOC126672260 [Mercurialis annua]
MSKTYDRVRWDFIRVMMLNLGFSSRWVDLTNAFLMSIRYTSIGDILRWLTSLLIESEQNGRLHGIGVCRGAPAVSHLFFTDCCYLFFRASLEEAEEIKRVLDLKVTVDQGKYLGLPSLIGRNKRQNVHFIKDRIRQKGKGWNAKFHSKSGKEVCIQSISQSIPKYIMNVFLIPNGLCDEIKRMMNLFWWGRNQWERKGINWASWNKLCLPKKFGGLEKNP